MIYAEVGCSRGGADDVDDGVDCADFMEVDLFDRNRVDGGFGFTEQAKGAGGAVLYVVSKRGPCDDAEDGRKRAVVIVRVAVIMLVFVIMMGMAVAVFMGVAVLMRVVVTIGMRRSVRAIAGLGREDVNLCSGDAPAHDFAGFEMGADVQRRRSLLKDVEREAGVDHRAKQHVATDSREAIEVCNPHRK